MDAKIDLKTILDLHQKWRMGEDGGTMADLRGADLRGADLGGADLEAHNGIHPARKPMEGGFSLEKFLANVDLEDAKTLGDMFDQMEAKKEAERKADEDYRAALAKAEARIAELEATIGALGIGSTADECAAKRMVAAQAMADDRDRYRRAVEWAGRKAHEALEQKENP